jgi:hypothetical protein
MAALTVIGYIIGGIICLIIILFGFIKLMTYLADKGAVKKGEKYCIEKGYEFKRVEIYPNHYGLFLSYQKMQIYASFDYERDGSLTWKKGSPEEKIRKRLDKKKQNK